MRDPMWDYRGVDKDEISGQSMNTHDFNNYRPREDRLVALKSPYWQISVWISTGSSIRCVQFRWSGYLMNVTSLNEFTRSTASAWAVLGRIRWRHIACGGMEPSEGECPKRGPAVPRGFGYLNPLTPLSTAESAIVLNLNLIRQNTWFKGRS